MGLLLGGPIALKQEGQFGEELIVLFMFLTFLITAFTEIFHTANLVVSPRNRSCRSPSLLRYRLPTPADYYAPQPRSLAEPLPSVTENTTRTLNISAASRVGKTIRDQVWEEFEMKRLMLILLLAVLFAAGCMHHDQVVGSGQRLREKSEVAAFTSIKTEGAMKLKSFASRHSVWRLKLTTTSCR